jgi:hypothetical protein
MNEKVLVNNKDIYIIDNFILEKEADAISRTLQPLLQASHDPLIKCTLGFPTQEKAASMNLENLVIPATGNLELDNISLFITKTGLAIRDLVSKTYNKKLKIIQLTFNQMLEGSSNHLHIDDATGMYSELGYAALLYINEYDKDYTGGQISFPKQNILIGPKKGTLVFFKGDEDKPHEVKKVLSGKRENIIMFFTIE